MGQGSINMLGYHAYHSKFMIHEKGAMHQVICKICTSIEGKEISSKVRQLAKTCWTLKMFGVLISSINVGSYYFNKNSMHMKNEHVYIANSPPFILD
jgi:hypothetical protein